MRAPRLPGANREVKNFPFPSSRAELGVTAVGVTFLCTASGAPPAAPCRLRLRVGRASYLPSRLLQDLLILLLAQGRAGDGVTFPRGFGSPCVPPPPPGVIPCPTAETREVFLPREGSVPRGCWEQAAGPSAPARNKWIRNQSRYRCWQPHKDCGVGTAMGTAVGTAIGTLPLWGGQGWPVAAVATMR